MYDKQVRRRRAVLGLCVGLSLLLLTAYFGESAGGGLHSVQRGVSEVLSPIQSGASTALKPFRDAIGWVGDTLDAKDERDKLKTERDRLRDQAVRGAAALEENRQLKAMLEFTERLGLDEQRPLTARVISRSPTLWYTTIKVDRGSGDGVRVDQPVVNGEGLVGRVTEVTPNSSVITLITDHTSGVQAKVPQAGGDRGVLQTAEGNPRDLLLEFLPSRSRIREGDAVVTSGTTDEDLPSPFPANIPIGEVTRVESEELELYQRVHLRAYADLRRLDFVQILTDPAT